jgi:hypothetical protein
VLDDLVVGITGATTNDSGIAVTLEGKSIYGSSVKSL